MPRAFDNTVVFPSFSIRWHPKTKRITRTHERLRTHALTHTNILRYFRIACTHTYQQCVRVRIQTSRSYKHSPTVFCWVIIIVSPSTLRVLVDESVTKKIHISKWKKPLCIIAACPWDRAFDDFSTEHFNAQVMRTGARDEVANTRTTIRPCRRVRFLFTNNPGTPFVSPILECSECKSDRLRILMRILRVTVCHKESFGKYTVLHNLSTS
jgi:hypothetical protein